MKKTRYTEEQIAFALRQAKTGTPAADMIRPMADFGADVLSVEEGLWRLGVAEVRRMKYLEEEKRS